MVVGLVLLVSDLRVDGHIAECERGDAVGAIDQIGRLAIPVTPGDIANGFGGRGSS
jgi:hypothetical protein